MGMMDRPKAALGGEAEKHPALSGGELALRTHWTPISKLSRRGCSLRLSPDAEELAGFLHVPLWSAVTRDD